MLFADLAATSVEVAATPARSRKVALLADVLRRAAYDEVGLVVGYLSGSLRQRRTGVGYRSLQDLPEPAATATLTVTEVDLIFEAISACSGAGSQAERARLLTDVFARATADEQRLLIALVAGDLRQGALASVVADAAAKAAGVPLSVLRRAAMLRGALPPVATAVMQHGADALSTFRLEVGRPVQPMLAATAADVGEAMAKISPAAVEWKLDGIRVQVHRDGDVVQVFTRTLDDITVRVPEVVADALSLPVRTAVLDGEAIAIGPDGRPWPFQVTASRAASKADASGTTLTTWFFDVLHLDGADLLELPGAERSEALARVVPEGMRVPRLVTSDVAAATAFAADAVARGHEGVVVKSLAAPYDAGRRGAGWLKVKPRHTLDLVVLAAEWGHGRRKGWLSNLHLGALDPATGGHVMLGKTFKGLTDEMLRWQTEKLLSLEVDRNDWQVFVRPELLVEIAFDGVQTSPRYPGGVALRFARVLRYRDDKPVAEADTIDAVRALHTPT